MVAPSLPEYVTDPMQAPLAKEGSSLDQVIALALVVAREHTHTDARIPERPEEPGIQDGDPGERHAPGRDEPENGK
jgi:hypothetical protein